MKITQYLPFIIIVMILSAHLSCNISEDTVGRGNIGEGPDIEGCPVFPANNIWNTPVDDLPVNLHSDEYIVSIGTEKYLHPDFGSGTYLGAPIGIPFITVNALQPSVTINYTAYGAESDAGPFPIPLSAPVEGGDEGDGDRHVIAIDTDRCVLYELYRAFPDREGNRWDADSGVCFDLKSNDLRPAGWTSADAAGLPIFPGLVRYDEVASGEIKHALRFTVSQTQKKYVWPARHYASSITNEAYPPMGQRFRLKSGYDVTGFSREVKVILQALKTYGMILADNGSSVFISGAPDERWNNDILRELRSVTAVNFEAVDVSSLMVDEDSAEAK
ncbi:MAG: hypothetical protein JW881_01335 [Spirochaetales bacterium]|nr:hypothetical protein [Spirochaetales bacterium]